MSTNDPSWPSDSGDDAGAPPPPPPSPTPPPPPGPDTSAGTAGATVGIRFVARLIDGIITAIISVVIGFVLPGDGFLLSSIVGAVISLGYFALLESNSGATPGKQLLGLKVIGPSGDNPTIEESLKRNVWLGFQVVPFIGGLAGLAAAIAIAVTISSSDRNRGWHDEFGGTTVLKT